MVDLNNGFLLPLSTRAALATIQQQVPQRLGNTLSDLLDDAVSDAERVMGLEGVTLNMGVWFDVTGSDKCELCLAGAVMLCRLDGYERTCGQPPDTGCLVPADVEGGCKLQAIDRMRSGNFGAAWLNLTGFSSAHIPAVLEEISARALEEFRVEGHGSSDGHLPWNRLRAYAAELREAGY